MKGQFSWQVKVWQLIGKNLMERYIPKFSPDQQDRQFLLKETLGISAVSLSRTIQPIVFLLIELFVPFEKYLQQLKIESIIAKYNR